MTMGRPITLATALGPGITQAGDALALTPLVIVAVIVAYVTAARITPKDPTPSASPAQPAATSDKPAGWPGKAAA